MRLIRSAIIGALLGFALSIYFWWIGPLVQRQFPLTPSGIAAMVAATNWFSMALLILISSVTWVIGDIRVFGRTITEWRLELGFWRSVWQILTFWR